MLLSTMLAFGEDVSGDIIIVICLNSSLIGVNCIVMHHNPISNYQGAVKLDSAIY